MSQITCILEETGVDRFPYRVRLERNGDSKLMLRLQYRWPGPRHQVFCLRDPAGGALEEVGRVPVASLKRFGRRLSLVLYRGQKRCEFLFLEKDYKDKPGSQEQIFFRTPGAIRGHRTRGHPHLHSQADLLIAIDSNEHYPWRFSGYRTDRRKLSVGDYALIGDHDVSWAMIEDKTCDNLLHDFIQVQLLP